MKLPEGASRVAISLDDPRTGPFVVVTREGRFVTCLGAGMTVADLPVVTRGQLDAITAKAEDTRARFRAPLRRSQSQAKARSSIPSEAMRSRRTKARRHRNELAQLRRAH